MVGRPGNIVSPDRRDDHASDPAGVNEVFSFVAGKAQRAHPRLIFRQTKFGRQRLEHRVGPINRPVARNRRQTLWIDHDRRTINRRSVPELIADPLLRRQLAPFVIVGVRLTDVALEFHHSAAAQTANVRGRHMVKRVGTHPVGQRQ